MERPVWTSTFDSVLDAGLFSKFSVFVEEPFQGSLQMLQFAPSPQRLPEKMPTHVQQASQSGEKFEITELMLFGHQKEQAFPQKKKLKELEKLVIAALRAVGPPEALEKFVKKLETAACLLSGPPERTRFPWSSSRGKQQTKNIES